MAKSRYCYLCNDKYEYCNCNRQPNYMATFCSENCKDIFHSLSKFGSGNITADECKSELENLDLSKKSSYKESVQNTINKIYTTSVAVVAEDETETKAEEPIEAIAEVIEEQTEPVEAEAEVIVEMETVTKTPIVPYTRKSYKHEVVAKNEL